VRCYIRTAVLAIALAGVVFGNFGHAVAADEPFDIDFILPMSGTLALAGHDINEALMAELDYVNKTGSIAGRPVRFVVHDDQSNPQLSVQLASA